MWSCSLLVLSISCCMFAIVAGCEKSVSSKPPKYYRDCTEALSMGEKLSGVYTIKPDTLPPFQVYCDMETDGGGWIVFQRRMDGTEDFFRNWADYVKGFGDLNREFWLGLSEINRLTQAGGKKLRVDMADFEGGKRYAKYSTFKVLDSSRKYQLNIGGYSGNAGNSLGYHNGRKFSTKDQDNDASSNNCAVTYKGAWWFGNCHHSDLNGRYLSGKQTTNADGVNWYHWKGHKYSLKITEMKLR